MSKEIRIGLLAIVAIAVLIWGYKYLLGQNLLKASNKYYIEYTNIDNLKVSDPVSINGFDVGTVQDIYLKPEDFKTIVVVIDVKSEVKLPPKTEAHLFNSGMMGSKAIRLEYSGVCSTDCLTDGDYLRGVELGFIQSMIATEELNQYLRTIKQGIGGVMDTVNTYLMDETSDNELGKTVRDLSATISNLKYTTLQLNEMLARSSANLVGTLENLEAITQTFENNGEVISNTLRNLNDLTEQLKVGRLDSTVVKTNRTLANTEDAIVSLQETMNSAQKTFSELNILVKNMNSGEGTLGGLVKDQELYDNLSSATRNLDLLLQDFRLNPKRYVNVSVFGKKQKDYALPETDPATTDTTSHN